MPAVARLVYSAKSFDQLLSAKRALRSAPSLPMLSASAPVRLPATRARIFMPIIMSEVADVNDECIVDAEDEFECFERECFGDEDGCDLWYYGETPCDVDARSNRCLSPEEQAVLDERVSKSYEEGLAMTQARLTKGTAVEAAKARVRDLVRQQLSQ